MQRGQGWVLRLCLEHIRPGTRLSGPVGWGAVAFLVVPGNVLLVGSTRGKGSEQTVIPF